MTHEEKLEEAKRLYQTANADQRYVLESLFPELKESKDERIRKEIIQYIKDLNKSGYLYDEEWIAWLEKQAPKPKWSEEDEEELEIAIETLHEAGQHSSAIWLKSLKKRMGGEE